MRILVAEDDAASRIVLSTVLAKEHYRVTAVSDGLAAWEAFQEPKAPLLGVLDFMMPGLNGLELVGRVRALRDRPQPYLIILTTRSDKSDVIAALDAGANDYLTKPFDPGELRARVAVGRRMVEMRTALDHKVEQLRQALEQIKTLRGIVPICANCKNVRDDQGYWNRVESYLNQHTEAEFSHAVCPDCMRRLYPQFKD
jgi:phosphoserine phosphatase RsbU/P